MYVSRFLEKVLNGDHDFCGLCYKTLLEERANLEDEVILNIETSSQNTLKISEILSYVLGEEVFADVTAFPTICFQCVALAVNSYKFIKVTKNNTTFIRTAVENLIDCFDYDAPENLTSLFVTLNPEDLNIGPQYGDDSERVSTKTEALTKFLTVSGISTAEQKLKSQQIMKNDKVEFKKIEYEKGKKYIIKSKNDLKKSTIDMVHNGDTTAMICKECLKEFPSVSNLRNHFLRIHAPKKFKCSECSKSFATQSLLKSHQAENHVNLVCSECGKTFRNVMTFKAHERTHHLKIICSDCGRVYKNQNTYKKHLDNDVCQTPVRHSPTEAKFTCDHCGKKYTQKISLRVHIQYEHLNYKHHVCKWCDKKFWCQARLKAHIVKHTKEKNFVCTICNGKFVTRESLLYHTRIHTGERPYPCPFCDSRFLSASRRQAHLRSQHTDPTVECDICHTKFKSVSQLIKHKLTHEQKSARIKTESAKEEEDYKITTHSGFIPEPERHNLTNLHNVLEEKVVYKIIDSDNIFELKTEKSDLQEAIFLEMCENGQYSIKVPVKEY